MFKKDQEYENTLNEIRNSGYVKAIIHYKNNSLWFWTHYHACDFCGITVPGLLKLFKKLPAGSIRGFDDDHKLFNLRLGTKGITIEKIS